MMAASQAPGDVDVQNLVDAQNVSVRDTLFNPFNFVDFPTVSRVSYVTCQPIIPLMLCSS